MTAPSICSLVKLLVCRRSELCSPHMGPHRYVCRWSKRILNIMLSRLASFGCVQVELIWNDESKGLCESFPDRQLDVTRNLFKLYGCSSSWVLLAKPEVQILSSFWLVGRWARIVILHLWVSSWTCSVCWFNLMLRRIKSTDTLQRTCPLYGRSKWVASEISKQRV